MEKEQIIGQLYQEKNRIQQLFSQVAGELSAKFFNPDKLTDKSDAMQQVLDTTRKILNAEKCALFLVDVSRRSLILERASGAVQFEKLKDVGTYDIAEYNSHQHGTGGDGKR